MNKHSIDYLYAGMIAGGLPQVKLYRSDSMEYLTRLSDLNRICDIIDLKKLDDTILSHYMNLGELEACIVETRTMYARAVETHRDELLRIKLLA